MIVMTKASENLQRFIHHRNLADTQRGNMERWSRFWLLFLLYGLIVLFHSSSTDPLFSSDLQQGPSVAEMMVSLGPAEISHRFQKLVLLSETKDRTACLLADWWRPDAEQSCCMLRVPCDHLVILPKLLGEYLKWTAPHWYKFNNTTNILEKRWKLVLHTSVCCIQYCQTLQEQVTQADQGWKLPWFFFMQILCFLR